MAARPFPAAMAGPIAGKVAPCQRLKTKRDLQDPVIPIRHIPDFTNFLLVCVCVCVYFKGLLR